jgi:hypothetical protein
LLFKVLPREVYLNHYITILFVGKPYKYPIISQSLSMEH